MLHALPTTFSLPRSLYCDDVLVEGLQEQAYAFGHAFQLEQLPVGCGPLLCPQSEGLSLTHRLTNLVGGALTGGLVRSDMWDPGARKAATLQAEGMVLVLGTGLLSRGRRILERSGVGSGRLCSKLLAC